jgi:DNA-binding PadR family transcriptional regulator
MSANSVSFRHFILGLIIKRPLSGYDIKRVLKSLGWLVGEPSFGSLYPALNSLQKDGLVTMATETRPGKPSRKIYSITESGKQTLQEWVNRPAGPNASLRAFVMRLILSDNYSQAGMISQLYQRRAQIATHCAALEKNAELQNGGANLGQRLALDYGLALAKAELSWLDSTLERLSGQPQAMEVVRGR